MPAPLNRSTNHHYSIALLATFLAPLICAGWLRQPVIAQPALNTRTEKTEGTLAEIKDKKHVALLVIRSAVVDASGSEAPVIREALAANPKEATRYRIAYGLISRKLNQYMRKHRSLSAVYEIEQADFIIYFRLLEYRRLLNGYYPYGELFVIANQRSAEMQSARVIWKTRKVMNAEDAVKELVKGMKQVRDER